MKKTVSVLILSIICISSFTSLSYGEAEDCGVYELMIKTYEASRDFTYANAEKALGRLFYANAKTSDKYGLRAFLTNTEDNNTSFRERVVGSLSNGSTMTPDQFFLMFREYCPQSAHTVSTLDDIRSKPDTSVVSRVLFGNLSGKSAKSSDGALWMYSSNYVVSFVKRKPCFILRSSRGMKHTDTAPDAGKLIVKSRIFDGTITCETISDDGNFVKTLVKGRCGSVTVLSCKNLSSPIFFDFSQFNENTQECY